MAILPCPETRHGKSEPLTTGGWPSGTPREVSQLTMASSKIQVTTTALLTG